MDTPKDFLFIPISDCEKVAQPRLVDLVLFSSNKQILSDTPDRRHRASLTVRRSSVGRCEPSISVLYQTSKQRHFANKMQSFESPVLRVAQAVFLQKCKQGCGSGSQRGPRILMMRAFNPNVDVSICIRDNVNSLPHVDRRPHPLATKEKCHV